MNKSDQYLSRIQKLNVNKQGERRAPHKPLLLLVAISKLLNNDRELTFKEVEKQLKPLLHRYAPQVKGRHQPELPYWHLRSDHLWEVPGANEFPQQKGGFPQMSALRGSSGYLEQGFAEALLSDKEFLYQVVTMLLEAHFPESRHDDILAATGLTLPDLDETQTVVVRKKRDPRFRKDILRAYEHRCAVTGFGPVLEGSFLGCEAAHVRWHAYDGPDSIDNGLALEPTLHMLLDVGAWSLTDDRRVIVSQEFSGVGNVDWVRDLHGREIRPPIIGELAVSTEYIQWHREPELGGVFRQPAMKL